MEKNIYQALADARVATQKRIGKKSGHNKYAGFDYFELKDFLPIVNEELAREGLCAVFNITYDKSIDEGVVFEVEYANLTIHDTHGNHVNFQSPTADASTKGATPIQALGSKHTYMKRYLYLNAMEISESDFIDATIGKEEQEQPKPAKQTKAKAEQPQTEPTITDDQKATISAMETKLQKWVCSKFKKESIDQLTAKEAEWFIKAKNEKEKKNGTETR